MIKVLSKKLFAEPRKSMWSGALRDAFIWIKASKWSKMSKCKNIVRQLQSHLIIQKNRREAIARQARTDIAQLLQIGQLEQALSRIEKLYKDQCLLEAYDQIDTFCNCIATNVAYIYRSSSTFQDLPRDVGEAMASLIYAASRCGELPELHLIRCLFKEKYGWEFDNISVGLRPGNLVNPQLKEKLGITMVPEDVKQELIGDIVSKCNVRMALNDSHETQNTTHENNTFPERSFNCELKSDGIGIQVPNLVTEENKIKIFWSLSKGKLAVATPSNSQIGSSNGIGGSSSRAHAGKSSNENGDGSKMGKSNHSFDHSLDQLKLPNGSSPCHVHPKLPDYDDVVAKLSRLKAEHRRRKTFAFF